MPGFPSSARCLDCKRRKVKCDLRWPICSMCERAGLECSGPTLTTKFIHAGDQGHSTDHNASESVTVVTDSGTSRLDATDAMPWVSAGFCTRKSRFNSIQSTPKLRQYPSTTAERVALRLIHTIERDPGGEILHNAGYLKLLPERMKESPALRDCTAFFCHTWTNLLRFEHVEKTPAFISAYGKALRSLMRVTQNQETKLSIETCAAATLMGRCNLLFDGGNMAVHYGGIAQMMRKMGPHKKGDELHEQLARCNSGTALRHWAAHGGEKYHVVGSWKDALGSTDLEGDAEGALTRLDCLTAQWPILLTSLKEVYDPYIAEDERIRLAKSAHELVTGLVLQCDDSYQCYIQNYESGMSLQSALGENYPSRPSLEKLPSNHMELLKPLAGYMVGQITFSRIAFDLSCVLRDPDGPMYQRYHQACRQAWGLLPHLGKIKHSMTVLNYATAIYLSFETVEEQDSKDYLIDTLKATNIRRILPEDRRDTEKWLINLCRLTTGRSLIG